MEILWDSQKLTSSFAITSRNATNDDIPNLRREMAKRQETIVANDKYNESAVDFLFSEQKLSRMSRRASDWCDISSIYVVTDRCAQYAHTYWLRRLMGHGSYHVWTPSHASILHIMYGIPYANMFRSFAIIMISTSSLVLYSHYRFLGYFMHGTALHTPYDMIRNNIKCQSISQWDMSDGWKTDCVTKSVAG